MQYLGSTLVKDLQGTDSTKESIIKMKVSSVYSQITITVCLGFHILTKYSLESKTLHLCSHSSFTWSSSWTILCIQTLYPFQSLNFRQILASSYPILSNSRELINLALFYGSQIESVSLRCDLVTRHSWMDLSWISLLEKCRQLPQSLDSFQPLASVLSIATFQLFPFLFIWYLIPTH